MRRSWLIAATLVLSTGVAFALADPPKAEGPPTPPQPVDGMLCVGEKGSVESPVILGDALQSQRVGGGGHIPNCLTSFSSCPDVPGRNCSLQNCQTFDLGYSSCRRPNGIIISCSEPGWTIHKTTCDCEEQYHDTCCDAGNCSWGPCGTCTGGSLSTVCAPGGGGN